MNLRYLASAALATAVVAAISFPASAELVVNTQAPVVDKAASQPYQQAPSNLHVTGSTPKDSGVIEFSARPSNTIVRAGGTSTVPSGDNLNWNRWSSQDKPAAVGAQQTVVVASEGRLNQIARESAQASDLTMPVRGWADQVPLERALAQVVPGDWPIQARGVDLKRLTSWRGNKPWVEVLSDITRQGKFNANVVWDRKVVVVFPLGALDGTAQAPLSPKVAVAAPKPVVVAPVVPLVKTWKIDPKLTLRGNVEAWTKQAGWNAVVWEAADYPIVAPAVLDGEFSSPNGPLAKLIDAYRDSDQPLQVRLSSMDKVVHVTNKNYDAPTVAPLTPQVIVPNVFNK